MSGRKKKKKTKYKSEKIENDIKMVAQESKEQEMRIVGHIFRMPS